MRWRNNLAPLNFLVIGAMRCATGWIRQCLREHPDIYMPQKEPHFFDVKYEKGSDWYLKTFFYNWKNEKAIGEKTATYLHTKEAALRIHEFNPKMKLICSLRDPVERLYSHYIMKNRKLSSKDLLDEITLQSEYVQRSLYHKQLQWFLEYFPKEDIYIVIYEEKKHNPIDFIQKIYRFLEVDDGFKPPSAHTQTKPGRIELQSHVWSYLSRFTLHSKSPIALKNLYSSMRPQKSSIELDRKEFIQLAKFFKNDISFLEEMLERELKLWRSRLLTQL
jgi:hypothetical protein